MKAKKMLAIMVSLSMVGAALAGCSGTGNTEGTASVEETAAESESLANANINTELTKADNVDPGTLNVAIGSTVTSLGPFVAAQNGYNFVKNYVYETLGEFGDGGTEFQGVIAKSWEQTDEEGFEYDVEIYDYVKDSNGNSITAEDVAWGYNTMIERGTNAMVSEATIESVEAVNDTTVHFVLAKNNIGAIESALRGVPIVSKAEFEKSTDEMASSPVGTGQYVVTSFVSDSAISFEKRADYWQTDESLIADISRGNVSKVNVQEITETSQMATAL